MDADWKPAAAARESLRGVRRGGLHPADLMGQLVQVRARAAGRRVDGRTDRACDRVEVVAYDERGPGSATVWMSADCSEPGAMQQCSGAARCEHDEEQGRVGRYRQGRGR
jgi:hypothetical protein